MQPDTYLLYTDESGDNQSTVMCSLVVPIHEWRSLLRRWLQFRAWMFREHKVPASHHLHANKWVTGKDTVPGIATRAAINADPQLRQNIAIEGLTRLSKIDPAQLAVTRCDHPRTPAAYKEHIDRIDAWLGTNGDLGVVVYDNPGPHSTSGYLHDVHRGLKLNTRNIIEDAWHQPAAASQLLQIADLAAYCVHAASIRDPSRSFMWDWYSRYLAAKELDL